MAIALATQRLPFGALPFPGGARFRVLAPGAGDLSLVIHDGGAAGTYPLQVDGHGVAERAVDGVAPGDHYSYRIDGHDRPDPASRFQPHGVHGPSEVIDPDRFRW